MKILLIDTCGEPATTALADSGSQPGTVFMWHMPSRTASERLLASIRERVSPIEVLDAVAVVHGPGSFTGVRVGVAAAKGLCEALTIPVVAVSKLAVLASLANADRGVLVHAVLGAGRGEIYVGTYQNGLCLRERLVPGGVLVAELAQEQQLRTVVTCEPRVAEIIAAIDPRLIESPTAQDALPLALSRLQRKEVDDVSRLDANYLRRTDAEIFARPSPPKATNVSL